MDSLHQPIMMDAGGCGSSVEDFTTFVLSEATGRTVKGQVSTSSLRVLYEAGLASALASHLFSGVGGSGVEPKAELFFSIPFTLGLETLEAIKDVILKHSAHYHNYSHGLPFQVRVPHHVHGAQLFPFLKALDFLGLPIDRNHLEFETVAIKWQYELVSHLEAMAKALITEFLEPALLGKMCFWHLHQAAVFFGHPSVYTSHRGVHWVWNSELAECPALHEHLNLCVFASTPHEDSADPWGTAGPKDYRIYQLPDGWRTDWDMMLQDIIAEKTVEAEDDFDSKLKGLFAGKFEKTVLLNAIKSSSAFKGLQVQVLEDLPLVLFTHTLEVEDL